MIDITRRRIRVGSFTYFFWLAVAALMFLGAVFWISDRAEVCVSSMMVEAGQEPVTNPVTCE